jgi:hypothetical protein
MQLYYKKKKFIAAEKMKYLLTLKVESLSAI